MEGGAYTADRAAALSGVPRSTVHYWARERIVVPSLSPARVKLWSYADLLALRTVYWLRQRKLGTAGHEIPASTMRDVRRALEVLRGLELDVFHDDGHPRLRITPGGRIVLVTDEGLSEIDGQQAIDTLDLIAPFTTVERTRGVDLLKPAKLVRIVPRKLGGAPHILGTRIDTEGLAALEKRGFDVPGIQRLYPDLTLAAIEDGLRVERQLGENLAA